MAGRAARGGPLCVGVLIFVKLFASVLPAASSAAALNSTRAWRVLSVSDLSCRLAQPGDTLEPLPQGCTLESDCKRLPEQTNKQQELLLNSLSRGN